MYDLTAVVLFVVLECFPRLSFSKESYWSSRTTYLPTIGLAFTFMLLFIRVLGVASLVLERAAHTFYSAERLDEVSRRGA